MNMLSSFSLSESKPIRYRSLDLWRGIACLFVVVFHSVGYAYRYNSVGQTDLWSALIAICWVGWIGVPLFFVISGYCITASVERCAQKESGGFPTFIYRRIRRIYPPYWIAVLLLTVIGFVVFYLFNSRLLSDNIDIPFRPPWWKSWWQIFGNITLTESWRWHLIGEGPSLILGVAWTLCYEEQFYLVMGLMMLATQGKNFYLWISLASLPSLFFFGSHSVKGLFFDGYWLMFAAGIFSYYLIKCPKARLCGLAALIVSACVVARKCALNEVGLLSGNDMYVGLLVALLFSAVLVLLYPFDSAICKFRVFNLLGLLGRRCYSMYLVHFPLVVILSSYLYFSLGWKSPCLTLLLTVPLCLLITLIATEVFFRTVEMRFLSTSSAKDGCGCKGLTNEYPRD